MEHNHALMGGALDAEQGGDARPAVNRPGASSNVIDQRRLRDQRRASRELDRLLGVPERDRVEPDWDQFALGWNERRAAA